MWRHYTVHLKIFFSRSTLWCMASEPASPSVTMNNTVWNPPAIPRSILFRPVAEVANHRPGALCWEWSDPFPCGRQSILSRSAGSCWSPLPVQIPSCKHVFGTLLRDKFREMESDVPQRLQMTHSLSYPGYLVELLDEVIHWDFRSRHTRVENEDDCCGLQEVLGKTYSW